MIVLASASPRRRELLKRIVDDFIVTSSDINEEQSYAYPPLEAVLDIAKRKGLNIIDKYPNDIVITADTIVVLDNQIIGKPKDKKDAKRILKLLSNNEHEVITAYCIFNKGQMIEKYVSSKVLFYELSDDLIDRYIATGSPLDKAGAYGVQDNDKYPIVKAIIGSVDNVIGFPVEEIQKDLEKLI